MRRSTTVQSPRYMIMPVSVDQPERGVVSLMVTLVMMIVITLVVLGFAEIARDEQRSSLDDQLSVEAYYAAESGINDARAVINDELANSRTPLDKTTCDDQGKYDLDPTVDAVHNVAYTCVLVNTAPPTLTYTVGYTSTVIPLISASSAAFGKLTLDWQVPSSFTASAAGCYTPPVSAANLNANPVASAWPCNYPMLRIDLLDANSGLSRANWGADTSTMFFVPFNSGSVSNTVALGAKGTAVPARCNSTDCEVNISGLGGKTYYMRVTTLYRTDSSLTISSPGNSFAGAQATIDSTGRAQDVLRRILVAVDLTDANAYHIPNAAIIVRDSICKRFSVTPGSFQIYTDLPGGGGNTYCSIGAMPLGSPSP